MSDNIKRQKKYFFDIHSHAFTISHAGLLSYINHFLKKKNYTFKELIEEDPFNIIYHLIGLDPENKKKFDILAFVRKFFVYFLIAIIFLVALSIFLVNLKTWLIVIPVAVIIATVLIIYYAIKKTTKKAQTGYHEKIKKPINLLSIMENDIGSALLRMEWDVLALEPELANIKLDGKSILDLVKDGSLSSDKKDQITKLWDNYIEQKGGFKIGEHAERITKYILTPLIVDFGYKDYNIEGIHYKNPPSKPVVVQVIDTFAGIISYMKRSPFHIFQIFPFMGINPQHYQLKLDENSQHDNSIDTMFNKYFGGFGKNDLPEERFAAFQQKMPHYSEDLDKTIEEIVLDRKLKGYTKPKDATTEQRAEKFIEYMKTNCDKINIAEELEYAKYFYNHFFVGVKVYPPLGFDPWPDGKDSDARKKVVKMYEDCLKYNLPIVTHCNFGGFTVVDDKKIELYTNPKRWETILETYNNLKVDFAHVGGDHEGDFASAKVWRDKIFDFIIQYENVYTDFSCMCFNDNDYKTLNDWIEEYLEARSDQEKKNENRQKIYKRIIYGSDFSINLLWDTNSYEQYLDDFIQTKQFTEDIKDWFSQENPKRFLFGG